MKRCLTFFGWVLCGVTLCGCSTFNRDWQRAAAQPAHAGSLEGAWQGTWLSARNGHTGKLRALLTNKSNEVYATHFHATFWKVFSAGYEVDLRATPAPQGHLISGSADLGRFLFWPLGEYACQGAVSNGLFLAQYTNRYDHGTFELRRPAP